MDTSSIPVNVAGVYDVLLECLKFFAVVWGVSKVVQIVRRS